MGRNLVYGIIVCVIYVDVELDKRFLGVYMCEFILYILIIIIFINIYF